MGDVTKGTSNTFHNMVSNIICYHNICQPCVTIYSHANYLGDITVLGIIFTADSDLNGATPQFTLTCTSTGGPATTVTWTRDSVTVTEGTETVLDDPLTAQYTHTLTVTGRLEGLYTCTVANNKPSNNSADFNVQSIH